MNTLFTLNKSLAKSSISSLHKSLSTSTSSSLKYIPLTSLLTHTSRNPFCTNSLNKIGAYQNIIQYQNRGSHSYIEQNKESLRFSIEEYKKYYNNIPASKNTYKKIMTQDILDKILK